MQSAIMGDIYFWSATPYAPDKQRTEVLQCWNWMQTQPERTPKATTTARSEHCNWEGPNAHQSCHGASKNVFQSC